MAAILKILKTRCRTLSDDLFLGQVSKGSAVRFPRNGPDKIDVEEKSGIIRIARFDCVWMQTQKFPNDPISEFGHVDASFIITIQFLTSKYS